MGKSGEKYYDREDVITSYGKYHRPFCHVLRNVANYNRKRLRSWKDAQARACNRVASVSLTVRRPARFRLILSYLGKESVPRRMRRAHMNRRQMYSPISFECRKSRRRGKRRGPNQMERFVELMKSTDRASCEQELRARFNSVWGKLCERVRSLLLASEQVSDSRICRAC